MEKEQEQLSTSHLDDLEPADDPWIGKVLGERYRVLKRLGRGGMGSVYEAEHTMIGRKVAIKLLHVELGASTDAVRRFMNEARAAGMLGHPNILESTDMGRADDGSPFLVLELLRGNDLGDEVKREGALPIGRSVRIALQMCAGLGAAHAKGIVHRDVKPDNVFLTERDGIKDHVKLLDFGISKFTGSFVSGVSTKPGAIIGTPNFMAPEQVRDSAGVDNRTDIYAVGCVLYVMLTASYPFEGSRTLPDLLLKIISEDVEPLDRYRRDIPAELDALVARAMAKDPDERFASVMELADAIRPFDDHDRDPLLNEARPEARRGAESGRRARPLEAMPVASTEGSGGRRWLVGGIAALLLAWGGAVYGLSWDAEPTVEPSRADLAPESVAPGDAGQTEEPSTTVAAPVPGPVEPAAAPDAGDDAVSLAQAPTPEVRVPRPRRARRGRSEAAAGATAAAAAAAAAAAGEEEQARRRQEVVERLERHRVERARAREERERRFAERHPGPPTPTPASLSSAMRSVEGAVAACGGDAHGLAQVHFRFTGHSGRPLASVSGDFPAFTVQACISTAVNRVRVPVFSEGFFHYDHTFRY